MSRLKADQWVLLVTVLFLTGIALLEDINLGGKFLLAGFVIAVSAFFSGIWREGGKAHGGGRPGEGMIAPDITRPIRARRQGQPMTGDDAAHLLGIAFGALVALEDPARDRAGEAQRILRAGLQEMELIAEPLANARVRPVR